MGKLIKLTNPNNKVHTCTVCGNFGEWDKNWCWKHYIPHKRKYEFPHEEIIKMCSNECVEIWNQKQLKELAPNRGVKNKGKIN